MGSILARATGCFSAEWRMLRFYWGEISWGGGVALMWWPGAFLHVNFWPIHLYLNDPRADRGNSPWDGPQYGFSWNAENWFRTLHLRWGKRSKVVWMPWCWHRVRHEYLAADGSWKAEPAWSGRLSDPLPKVADRWEADEPYRYCLRSFEVQERVATYRVSRAEWRWSALRWLPFPRRIETGIDVEFSDEVGERTGSWKGGTVGCSYTMRKNETPLECLRRMERERKF